MKKQDLEHLKQRMEEIEDSTIKMMSKEQKQSWKEYKELEARQNEERRRMIKKHYFELLEWVKKD